MVFLVEFSKQNGFEGFPPCTKQGSLVGRYRSRTGGSRVEPLGWLATQMLREVDGLRAGRLVGCFGSEGRACECMTMGGVVVTMLRPKDARP